MIANYHSIATDLISLRRRFAASQKGTTLAQVRYCLEQLGLTARALRCDVSDLHSVSKPCILHWRFDHFVLLSEITTQTATLFDPARGIVHESITTVRENFTGVALEVTALSALRTGPEPLRLKLSHLALGRDGLYSKFAAGLLLAAICEVLLLTSPVYLQLVIDQVLGKSDAALLDVLLVGSVVILLFSMAASVLRQLVFLFVAHVAAFDMMARVLRRLLSLPARYFRDRELGDVQHRFQSLVRIQNFIVHGVPALALDTIFTTVTAVVLLIYEPTLTLIMVAVIAVWVGWRVSIYGRSLLFSSGIAQAEARVQSHFLESLRNVQPIKAANGEMLREEEWLNLFADAGNAKIRLGRLLILDSVVGQLLFNGARIAAIYYLATVGLVQQMSIGAISAYAAYLGMFTTRCSGIVDRILEFKLLDVPLQRLSDIVFSAPEPQQAEIPASISSSSPSAPSIELRGLSFSYDGDSEHILNDCSVRIEPGSLVAIAGASGVGKSTLLQVLACNEQPGNGDLLIDGRVVQAKSIRSVRAQLAAVFQEDGLLKGSIAENIAFLSGDVDDDRIAAAAAMACIDQEIAALPMGYWSRVGDLGSTLSRGQIQRVLLARAYYRNATIMLLDEATSGLDQALERRVIANLLESTATRIAVTHSDLMLQAADQVLWLREGRLLSSPHG